MQSGFSGRRRPKRGVSTAFRTPSMGPGPGEIRGRRLRQGVLAATFAFSALMLIDPFASYDATLEADIENEVIASREWVAEFSFETIDLERTEVKRAQAESQVPDAYVVQRYIVAERLARLDEHIGALAAHREPLDDALRAALLASDSSLPAERVIRDAVSAYLAGLPDDDPALRHIDERGALSPWLFPRADSTPRREFAEPAENDPAAPRQVIGLIEPEVSPIEFAHGNLLARWSRDALSGILTRGTLATREGLADDKRILLRPAAAAGEGVGGEVVTVATIPDIPRAEDLLQQRINEAAAAAGSPASEITVVPVESAALQRAAHAVSAAYLAPTLRYDLASTEGARSVARESVEVEMRRIPFGKRLQESNEEWSAQTRADVRTYLELKRGRQASLVSVLTVWAANLVLLALILWGINQAIPVMIARDGPGEFKTLACICLVLGSVLLIGRIAYYFDASGYIVPVAAGAILLGILIGPRVAVMASIGIAAMLSIQYGYSWDLLVLGSAMSVAGTMSISKVRKRGDMARAGVQAAVAGVLTALAVTAATDELFNLEASRQVALIGLNGLACLFLVPGILPSLERLFGITTDIQLLEYSDLNNEILSRLAIEVPATFAHSLMLGQLAEAACDAIGANGLMARVCAYYHDIGKTRRPNYFSENQTGHNIHEGLSPRHSVRAIAAHVTEGAEMARQMRLPQPIIDGILEHHGTSLVSFFYQRAVEQSKHGDVNKADFRYPGPRPQSRETAILMICDGVESGIRSIKNPNEERIREFIERIIDQRAEDGQFDECDLTLRNLSTIADVLTQRVMTSQHGRIAYPDSHPGKTTPNVIPMQGGRES